MLTEVQHIWHINLSQLNGWMDAYMNDLIINSAMMYLLIVSGI
jgi:hypothetical protein